MLVGYDHQVPRRVWIYVKDQKIKLGSLEDKVLLIACRVIQDAAKDATSVIAGTAAANVVVSPRAPENVHSVSN